MRKKNTFLLLAMFLLMLPATTISADTIAEGFDDKLGQLADMAGVESVSISPKKMLSLIDDKNRKEDEKLFTKMDALRILSVDKTKNSHTYLQITNSVNTYVSKIRMDEVMKLNQDGNTLRMYHKDNELLFITMTKTEYTVIYIQGVIDSELIQAVMQGKISFQ